MIRSIHVGPNVDSFRVDGHKFYTEKRMPRDPNSGRVYSRVSDTIQSGVSERFTLMLDGGAGGVHHEPGDYLYHDGVARRFRQGAWGIMRVLGAQAADLQPLPGYPAPGGTYVQPAVTGGRPPAAANPGNPCPAGSTPKSFAVSAVDVPSNNTGSVNGPRAAYVLSSAASSVKKNGVAEPLVLHVGEGDCVDVTLKNERGSARASFSVAEVAKAAASSGINIGFNPEQTVAPGKTQTYRFYVDNQAIESSIVADFGGDDTGKIGLYGAVVVAEPGATFTDPATGAAVTTGAQVDVHVPGKPGYRDSTLILSDTDPQIGADFMPYPKDVSGQTWVNYRNAGKHTNSFSGTPVTPVIKAYAGDPMKIHVITGPGSDQTHVFTAGGLDWSSDPYMPMSQKEAQHRVSPHSSFDVHINGGAGGTAHKTGDFFYGDGRRAFTEGGMWGLIRVSPLPSCTGSLVTQAARRLELLVTRRLTGTSYGLGRRNGAPPQLVVGVIINIDEFGDICPGILGFQCLESRSRLLNTSVTLRARLTRQGKAPGSDNDEHAQANYAPWRRDRARVRRHRRHPAVQRSRLRFEPRGASQRDRRGGARGARLGRAHRAHRARPAPHAGAPA